MAQAEAEAAGLPEVEDGEVPGPDVAGETLGRSIT